MKRSLIPLFILVCLGFSLAFASVTAAAPAEQGQFVAPRLVVNSSFLNIRSGPGVQYTVLLTVVGGTELPVLGRFGDNIWFQVSTVVGIGWVNVEFTIPRGNFDNVPVVTFEEAVAAAPISSASSLSMPAGQGGGGGAPSSASTTPMLGSPIRFILANNRVVTVAPGERFRAVINVEAVNVRTQPADGATAITTVFRDSGMDYSIVGSAKDSRGVEWVAIDVPDVGAGWIEAPKVFFRLSRVSGQVVIINREPVNMVSSPSGSGEGLPVLSAGREAYFLEISRDGQFVRIELGDGFRAWVPANATTAREGTPTDLIDLSKVVAAAPVTQPGIGGGASFGLDTPHVVVNTGFLNIRSGPGAQFSIVATVSGGSRLSVIGIASDRVWFLVQGSFGQGWVNSEFTLFRGSIDSVPVIRDTSAVGIMATPMAIISAGINLYAAPGTNFGIIGTLTGPLEIAVVARTADSQWLQVNSSLGFGWVLASQVVLQGDASVIPIVG